MLALCKLDSEPFCLHWTRLSWHFSTCLNQTEASCGCVFGCLCLSPLCCHSSTPSTPCGVYGLRLMQRSKAIMPETETLYLQSRLSKWDHEKVRMVKWWDRSCTCHLCSQRPGCWLRRPMPHYGIGADQRFGDQFSLDCLDYSSFCFLLHIIPLTALAQRFCSKPGSGPLRDAETFLQLTLSLLSVTNCQLSCLSISKACKAGSRRAFGSWWIFGPVRKEKLWNWPMCRLRTLARYGVKEVPFCMMFLSGQQVYAKRCQARWTWHTKTGWLDVSQ